MATLLLRNLPDDLYQQLKATAAEHHRSLPQEAIATLKGALATTPKAPPKPTWEQFSEQMQDLWAMPVLDPRTPDEIIGYDDNGLPG